MTQTTNQTNQILIQENQIVTEENQLTFQIDSNISTTNKIDLDKNSNNKTESRVQEQTETKPNTTTNDNTNTKKENPKKKTKSTTNLSPKTTKKKLFPKTEKKNFKPKPRTLYSTKKPKRSQPNTKTNNRTNSHKLKLESTNQKNLKIKTKNLSSTGNGHEGTLKKPPIKSPYKSPKKSPRLLYVSQKNTKKKRLSPRLSNPNFSKTKTKTKTKAKVKPKTKPKAKNYSRLQSSNSLAKKTSFRKKNVKALPSQTNQINKNNKPQEKPKQKQKQQPNKNVKKRYPYSQANNKSPRKKKLKKMMNRKNSIDDDLEIDPNFETRLKTPIKERILKRNMGLSRLDKKAEKKVLKHREATLKENFSDFPELEKERINKIIELKTPDLNRLKMEQFKQFLSQFDIDFLKQNQKEIEREINKERRFLGQEERQRDRKKKYNADPKKVRKKLKRFQEINDKQRNATTSKATKNNSSNKGQQKSINSNGGGAQHKQNGSVARNLHAKQKSKIKLITKSDMPQLPEVQGEMRYNPETQEWEGNEQELDAFDMKGPTLISNIDSTMTFTEFNGMKFNAEQHQWEGNDEEIDWGASSEDEDFLNSANSIEIKLNNAQKNTDLATNSRYKIKNTFLLDDKTRTKFKNLEKSNKSLMRNWSVDESLVQSKFSIRKFSLSYIVEKSKFL
ncbi:mitotic check point protein bfa1 [Anaeramoeba flamelloides]|uniref:Mitotic check point protein bfa1 n=1 Tax=Anaeramoeba flamelloides TaxID=1746091 RepID=A0ABQ8YW47_9EUKA|nr:mitotic check point protein bfa1 [Anaeramoeba flamelloides]